jgi:hypothetical protein
LSQLKYWNGSAWVTAIVGAAGATGPTGPASTTPGPAAIQTIVYNRSGAVAAVTGTQRFRFPAAATITGVSLALNTAGSTTTTVAVRKNGSLLTFAGALSLVASATGLGEQAITSSAAVVAGDYLTVDITAAGTGAVDLSVFIRYS